jgi:predicted Rossmann fold nucleotide-binding protein DprA/Smf involved in DNA uptake
VTGGRTEPADGEVLDLIAVVVATGLPSASPEAERRSPEHRRILDLCGQQVTVADLAADTALPVGVVRVLIADLTLQGAVTVVRQRPTDQRSEKNVLQEILDGLRAL